jgi:hypothetical protein
MLFIPPVQPALFQGVFLEPFYTAVKTDPIVAGDCSAAARVLKSMK